jgi:phosphatidylglycerol---prolipoprotein diacylglyceryl transferase
MINIFGVSIHLYGLIIGVAILSALQVSLKLASNWGVKKDWVEEIFWWVVVGGIIGARAYHVVHLWNNVYSLDPVKVFYVWQGGLGIWGGVVGGVVGLVGWKLKRDRLSPTKVSFLRLLDVMIVGLPLGQAIGRLGNWANGELVGKNGEPLFAIEAILNVGLFTVLWKLGQRKSFAGKIGGAYLIGYGLIRMILENFRPNEIIWKWHGIPMAVIFGGLSVVFGLTLIIWRRRQS